MKRAPGEFSRYKIEKSFVKVSGSDLSKCNCSSHLWKFLNHPSYLSVWLPSFKIHPYILFPKSAFSPRLSWPLYERTATHFCVLRFLVSSTIHYESFIWPFNVKLLLCLVCNKSSWLKRIPWVGEDSELNQEKLRKVEDIS